MQQLNSWLGHVQHCNSYTLTQKVLNSCDFLYGKSALSSIEANLIDNIEHNS